MFIFLFLYISLYFFTGCLECNWKVKRPVVPVEGEENHNQPESLQTELENEEDEDKLYGCVSKLITNFSKAKLNYMDVHFIAGLNYLPITFNIDFFRGPKEVFYEIKKV